MHYLSDPRRTPRRRRKGKHTMMTGIASVTFETQTEAETSLALYAMDMAIDANDGANPIAVELRKAQRAPRTKEGNLRFTISAMAMLQISIGFEMIGEIYAEEPNSFRAEEADALVAILAHNRKAKIFDAMEEGAKAAKAMRDFHRND